MNVFLRPVLIPYIIPQHNEAYPYRGCPPPNTSFLHLIHIYNKVYRSIKVVRKVSVSCTYPPFFVRWQPLYRGGLGKSFVTPLFQKCNPTL